jgi:hypothetical protein
MHFEETADERLSTLIQAGVSHGRNTATSAYIVARYNLSFGGSGSKVEGVFQCRSLDRLKP